MEIYGYFIDNTCIFGGGGLKRVPTQLSEAR